MFGRGPGDHRFTMGHLIAVVALEAMRADISATRQSSGWALDHRPDAGGGGGRGDELLWNETWARAGFEENEEAGVLYAYLTGGGVEAEVAGGVGAPERVVGPLDHPTASLPPTASSQAATPSPDNNTTTGDLYALLSLPFLSAQALIPHKSHYTGTEPLYSLFLATNPATSPSPNSAATASITADDIARTLDTWQKRLTHHATALLPGMVERVGAGALAERIAVWAVGEWYASGQGVVRMENGDERATGKERRGEKAMEVWEEALEGFRREMLEWEGNLEGTVEG